MNDQVIRVICTGSGSHSARYLSQLTYRPASAFGRDMNAHLPDPLFATSILSRRPKSGGNIAAPAHRTGQKKWVIDHWTYHWRCPVTRCRTDLIVAETTLQDLFDALTISDQSSLDLSCANAMVERLKQAKL